MDYKIFFTTNNKSGWKTKEDKIKNNLPELYKLIIDFNDTNELKNISFKQKIWHFINDIKTLPKCYCGNNVNFENTITKGYRKYCSLKCSTNSEVIKDKIKKTSLKKYGTEKPSQSFFAIEKRKKTCLEKYGVEYHIASKEIRNTIEENNLKKYGIKHTLKLNSVRNKIKKTNLEKYGVDNVFESEIIKNKIKETNLEKYGFEYPLQNNNILEKLKQNNLEKYGVDNVSKLDLIKNIISKKMLGREIKKEWIEKSIETRYGIKYNDYEKLKTDFTKYKRNVLRITNKQPIKLLENYDKRGKSGINGAYQLDHKYSIFEGFKNGVLPEIIGNIVNLEFIPWENNNIKRSNVSITIEELNKLINE